MTPVVTAAPAFPAMPKNGLTRPKLALARQRWAQTPHFV
jgi:hypothetical protein